MSRPDYQVTDLIMAIHKIPLHGNITPLTWFHHITHKNGKPNLVAITILSDIVYWYRPTEVRDEETGDFVGWKSKFRGDMLQRSYKQLSERFGITRTQAKDAIDYLISIDVLHREFRTIEQQGVINNNVMFVAPIADGIRKISESEDKKLTPHRIEPIRGVDASDKPGGMYPKTNTYTSSETTTKTSKNGINHPSMSAEPKKDEPEQTGMDGWMDDLLQNPNFRFLRKCGVMSDRVAEELMVLALPTLEYQWAIVKDSTNIKDKPGMLVTNLRKILLLEAAERAAAERAAQEPVAPKPIILCPEAEACERPEWITLEEWARWHIAPNIYGYLHQATLTPDGRIECLNDELTADFYDRFGWTAPYFQAVCNITGAAYESF